jgi:AcrR family transcriptional regulator
MSSKQKGEISMAGRPREFDRDTALLLARDLFWERGYEAVSMADLTEKLGLASARLYAAFGSKEDLFREAITHYEAQEGGFADRALAEEITAVRAIERMFCEGIELYTRKRGPRGCMVVSSATNCTEGNEQVREWLAEHRRARTASIVRRIQKAVQAGELPAETDASALGELYATALHGISVQARDGTTRKRLMSMTPLLLALMQSNPAR